MRSIRRGFLRGSIVLYRRNYLSPLRRGHDRSIPTAIHQPPGRERERARRGPELGEEEDPYGHGAYTLERTKKAATIFVRRFMEVTQHPSQRTLDPFAM